MSLVSGPANRTQPSKRGYRGKRLNRELMGYLLNSMALKSFARRELGGSLFFTRKTKGYNEGAIERCSSG